MEPRWVSGIVVRELELLKRELDAYPNETDLWKELPGVSNSAGTLTLHLAGNLQHFIGAEMGATGYVRQRELEFSRRAVTRAELKAEVDRAVAAVTRTLGSVALDPKGRLAVVGGKYTLDRGDWLLHLVSHLAFHIGQIDYHRRVVTGSKTSLDPVAIGQLGSAETAGA